MRDDLRAGARLRPRISDRHGEADETTRSGGSVKRSGMERGRRRRDADRVLELRMARRRFHLMQRGHASAETVYLIKLRGRRAQACPGRI